MAMAIGMRILHDLLQCNPNRGILDDSAGWAPLLIGIPKRFEISIHSEQRGQLPGYWGPPLLPQMQPCREVISIGKICMNPDIWCVLRVNFMCSPVHVHFIPIIIIIIILILILIPFSSSLLPLATTATATAPSGPTCESHDSKSNVRREDMALAVCPHFFHISSRTLVILVPLKMLLVVDLNPNCNRTKMMQLFTINFQDGVLVILDPAKSSPDVSINSLNSDSPFPDQKSDSVPWFVTVTSQG